MDSNSSRSTNSSIVPFSLLPPLPHARWWLLCLVAGGLALRLVGITFGLPLVDARPDEHAYILRALNLTTGDLNPHFFDHPSGFVYLMGGLFVVEGAVAVALGKAATTWSYLAGFFLDPTPFVLTARLLAVATSTATIYAIYRLGDLLSGWRTGLLAAAALTGSFLHVRDAHFGVIDSPLTFVIILAVASAIQAGRLRTVRSAFAAGGLAGMALALKYNAALLVLPLLVAFLVQDDSEGRLSFRPAPRLLAIALVTMIGVFLASTPYALLDWPTFWQHVSLQMNHLSEGHLGPEGNIIATGRGWGVHAAVSLPYGLGMPLLLVALLGVALRLRKPSAADLVVFSFPLAYYLGIGYGRTTFARYMLPVLPFACLAVGCTVDRLVAIVTGYRAPRKALAGGMLVVGLLLAPSLVRSVRFDILLGRTDTREVLAQWIQQHVPPATSVVWLGSYWGMPLIYHRTPPLVWRKEVDRLRRARANPIYTIHYLGYNPTKILNRLASWKMEFPLFVVETSPLVGLTVPVEAVPFLVSPYRYEKVFAIDPVRPGGPKAVYDQQDAFFLPLGGLGTVTQPGPTLTVYRLRSK